MKSIAYVYVRWHTFDSLWLDGKKNPIPSRDAIDPSTVRYRDAVDALDRWSQARM